MQPKLHFQGLIEVSMYTGSYTQLSCTSSQSHRVEQRFSCSCRNSFMIHIFYLFSHYLKQLDLFTVQCNLVPAKTASRIKKNAMENHKRNKSPLHITKYWTKYKPKGNRHEIHSIKWVEHVCKNYREQMMQRDRTPRQMSREAIFLGLHKKMLHLLNLTPSDLWQE